MIRGLAAIAVIWVHAGRSDLYHGIQLDALGRSGTAFLNVLAGFFVVLTLAKYLSKRHAQALSFAGSLWNFTQHRVWRIAAPFVVWCVLYVLSRGVNYVAFGKVTTLEWSWNLLFWGTTYHLWFLPYLLGVTLITLPIVALALWKPRAALPVAGVLGIAAVAMLAVPLPSWLPPEGAYDFIRALYIRGPEFLIGLMVGLFWHTGLRPKVTWTMVPFLAAAIITAAIWSLFIKNEPSQRLFFLVSAIAGLLMAMAPWRGVLIERLAYFGSLGFGVYLCHVLVIEAVLAVVRAAGIPATIHADLLVFPIAIVGSFALANLLRQSKGLRWLIP